MRLTKSRLLFSFVIVLFTIQGLRGQSTSADKLSIPEKALNFIVLGDWGRFGEDHQTQVAAQMVKTASEVHVSFFISTGDNFYPNGVASPQDPQWHYSFEEVYKSFVLQREWFVVLGNHDYLGNPDAQVEYSKISRRWVMPSRYYSKTVNLAGSDGHKVQFAFIDTNPLIPAFYKNPIYGPNVATQDSASQKKWLKELINQKDQLVKWNIVVGHHPLYTGSDLRREGYDTKSVRGSLNNLLETSKVDAYIAGHDHSLQHLQTSGGVHHFISGSASEVTQVGKIPITKFAASQYGFMLFSLVSNEMIVHVISHEGRILYRTVIKK
jgi:tartrate-resistant acid phosphatase type 5